MKVTVLSIINTLLLSVVAPSLLKTYIMDGYENQTMFAALIGAIIGTIIATQRPNKNVFLWLLLGIILITILFVYQYYLFASITAIPPGIAYPLLIALLIFFTVFAYILAFFELYVISLFSKKD